MANDDKRGRGFSRLETDAEFHARIRKSSARGDGVSASVAGAVLDDLAWQHFKLQRRIVVDDS